MPGRRGPVVGRAATLQHTRFIMSPTSQMSIPDDRLFRNLLILICLACPILLAVPYFAGCHLHSPITGTASAADIPEDDSVQASPHGPRQSATNTQAQDVVAPKTATTDHLTLTSPSGNFSLALIASDDGAVIEMRDLKSRNPRIARFSLTKESADVMLHGGSALCTPAPAIVNPTSFWSTYSGRESARSSCAVTRKIRCPMPHRPCCS